MLVLPKPFRRNIRIPISWFGCFDEPLMSIGGSAITPNRLLLVAGLGLFPTAIEGDPSDERARGTILTVSLSRSATLKAYRAGMDNIFGSVAARADGGAFACGFLTMPFLTGGFGWLLRLDAGGTPIWERGLGEEAPDATVFFHRIIATSDGGAFASGFLDEGSARNRCLVKISADGDVEFARAIRGLPNAEDSMIAEAAGGDLVVCFPRQPFLGPGAVTCRFDAGGTLQWQREMPDLNDPRGLAPLSDGSVLIVGGVAQSANTPAGPRVIRLDSGGSIVDVKRIAAENEAGDALSMRVRHLSVTSGEGILILGSASAGDNQSRVVAGRFDGAGQAAWGRMIDVDPGFERFTSFTGAELELTRGLTYLLTLGNANNEERNIRVPIARLDEHGDIGADGCGVLSPITLQLTSGTLPIQTSNVAIDVFTPPVFAASSEVTEPAISVRTMCVQEHHVKFDPPFVEPPLTVCFDDLPMPGVDPLPVPPGPGPGPDLRGSRFGSILPGMTCNSDPGCLRCLIQPDGTPLPNPPWRAELYRALRAFTMAPEHRVPVEAAEALLSAIAKLPAGELLTGDVKRDLRERVTRWKRMRTRKGHSYVPRDVSLWRHLAFAANLLDVDILVSRPRLEHVKDGVALKGLLTLRSDVRNLSRVRVGLVSDAPGPLLPHLIPGWPTFLWRVQAIDKSVNYDVEISYRGLRFSAPDAKLRLGQWRGRELRDITTAIDPARSTIIGRGSGPGVFAILETPRTLS